MDDDMGGARSTRGAGRSAPQVAGYRVEELVGFGGCGEVWRARDVVNGRLVALKVLRHDGPPAERDRLRREAAVLAGLRSPHVVRLLTVVTSARGLVLVLEFQGGGSLASLLRSRPRLAPGEVVTVAAPLAGALAEVHAAGVVHGDVSPANILFAVDGRPVLSDLGVSRLVGRAGAEAVTASYADPAVLQGAPLTPSSDVYALAAVCFEALAGQPPLAGDDVEAVLAAAGLARPALADLAPGVPPALSQAIEAALSPDVAARPDAAGLAAALLAACEALPVRLAGATVPVEAPPTSAVRRLPVAPVVELPVPSRLERFAALLSRVSVSPRRLVAAAAVPTAIAAAIWGGVAWARSGSAQGARPAVWTASATPTRPAAPPASPVTSAPSEPPLHLLRQTGPEPAVTATQEPATEAPAATQAPAAADLLTVVTRLDAQRDRAFVDGDASLLADVYASGSDPLVADTARLVSLLKAGEHARGLALTVRAVHVVARTTSTATLRVADVLGPYSLVGSDGRTLQSMPARGLTTWSMRLVRASKDDSGWRIAAIGRA
ncbi:hypothetical protein acdb102_36590 [Acidothermaceae bacterium B102]|nr:hypothetical protein acdb102_36590 [Acidothermaceae bacterium B102]